MAIPAARTLVKDRRHSGSELTIKVTGYQWKWQYEFVGHDVSFFSTLARPSDTARQLHSGINPASVQNYLLDVDHPLVVPQGVKVRVLLTSADVIHAWWVPDFGIKRDAIPGFINELWFKAEKTGTYRGQCAELCGRDHGFMPIVVDVRPKAEFEQWLEQQKDARQAGGTAAVPVAGAVLPKDPATTLTVASTEQ
jgi:cytochrome c oxidase subunit 2